MDIVLHKRLLQLQAENAQLREQLEQLKQEAYMNEGFLDIAKGAVSAVQRVGSAIGGSSAVGAVQSGIQSVGSTIGRGVKPIAGLQRRIGRAALSSVGLNRKPVAGGTKPVAGGTKPVVKKDSLDDAIGSLERQGQFR